MANKTAMVDYSELASIPTPQPTATWSPMAHKAVVDIIDEALDMHGLGVMKQRFEVAADGNKMFASYNLDQKHNGHTLQIGFRNSLDKSFAVGITAGLYTMVCSNLIFSGDYVDMRKHTKGLDHDVMTAMAFRAVETLGSTHNNMLDQMQQMSAMPLPDNDFKLLTFDAMKRGVVPPSQFSQLLKSWNTEASRDGQTLYAFHGAVTNTMSMGSLTNIHKKSKPLQRLLSDYADSRDFVLQAGTDYVVE